MSLRISRSNSAFSSHSGVGMSGFGSARGVMLSGGSYGGSVSYSGRAMSDFGGAGVYGSRISRSVSTSSALESSSDSILGANEKLTMQNLNDRLASYLERVRSLEEANTKLELQIKEFYDCKAPVDGKDLSVHYSTITDLRKQILVRILENAQIRLKLDNANLAAEDFQMKFETERGLCLAVEADIAGLKAALSELKLACGDLEIQITGFKDELLFLKNNHEEEMKMMQVQQSGAVNVQMDCASPVDLNKVLEDMREQYEALIQKNQRDAEQWFHSKGETLKTEITTSCAEIKTSQTELTDLKRTFQSLEIELQGLQTQKQYLEKSVAEIDGRFGAQLGQMQLKIDHLQEELQQVNASMQQQSTDYQLLLDIKMRLELEIAEYRRLLDGDWSESVSTTTTNKTVTETVTVSKTEVQEVQTVQEVQEEVEDEHNPLVQRRVKVIVEELVDGKVVSTSVDEKVQEVSS